MLITGNHSETMSVAELKDAIIELYLAIKIRSTEEVSLNFLSHSSSIRTSFVCYRFNLGPSPIAPFRALDLLTYALLCCPVLQLDQITDQVLEEEKRKLEKVSGFQVLEYVRTSIEIIMNLKIEDLEKEFNNRNLFEKDS